MLSIYLTVLLPLVCAFTQTTFRPIEPILAPFDVTINPVIGKYIITIKETADVSTMSFLQNAQHLGEKYFAMALDGPQLDSIREDSNVLHVETDQHVQVHRPIEDLSQMTPNHTHLTQDDAPWGLSRVSHRKKLDPNDVTDYTYDEKAGEGVYVYVIDTGVMDSNLEFEGRATLAVNFARGPNTDCNGHGTHCSGTIASKTYGIAKKAQIIGVKSLDCRGSGTMSQVIAGVNYALQDSLTKQAEASKLGKPVKTNIASMSLGGGYSRALNAAVGYAIESGLAFAVAAGNDDDDACKDSPASLSTAITVGASTILDERAYFSNKGKCVDIFAPGLSILSTWIGSPNATNTISGTSMATPHVAGIMAYFSSLSNTKITPKDLFAKVLNASTSDVLKDLPYDTANKLLNNNVDLE